MKKALSAVALAAGVALLAPAGATADPRPSRTVTYTASDAVIANPQRGFYHHTETHLRADGSGWVPLERSTLAGYRQEGVTQILRVVYLEKFVDTPRLDADVLRKLQRDFDTARSAGVSVILRFAYVQGGDWPYEPPYGDASLDVVLAHIHQLGPLLRRNADVIEVVQEGFIGLWGEGYYTDHFVADPANPGVVTAADWDKRNAVVHALLDELPPDRGVQVRTMLMKQELLGVPSGADSAVTADQAWTDTPIARVGHHNDCFLAAPDDWGTFLSDPLSLDQEYLAADSTYVPVGGETCNVNPAALGLAERLCRDGPLPLQLPQPRLQPGRAGPLGRVRHRRGGEAPGLPVRPAVEHGERARPGPAHGEHRRAQRRLGRSLHPAPGDPPAHPGPPDRRGVVALGRPQLAAGDDDHPHGRPVQGEAGALLARARPALAGRLGRG